MRDSKPAVQKTFSCTHFSAHCEFKSETVERS